MTETRCRACEYLESWKPPNWWRLRHAHHKTHTLLEGVIASCRECRSRLWGAWDCPPHAGGNFRVEVDKKGIGKLIYDFPELKHDERQHRTSEPIVIALDLNQVAARQQAEADKEKRHQEAVSRSYHRSMSMGGA